MKPETATAAVSLLLAGAALCVGLRHASDARQAAARAQAGTASASAVGPGEPSRAAKAERASAGSSDPEFMAKRLRALHATANEADRTRALLELVAGFEADDWPRALEEFAKIDKRVRGPSYVLILSAWAESDPRAAMTWAKSKPWAEPLVIRDWLAKDVDAAIAFLKSMDNGDSTRKSRLLITAIGLLRDDLPRIGQVLQAMPEEERWMASEQARLKIGKLPLEALKDWANSFDPSLKNHVLRMLLRNLEGFAAKLAFAHAFPDGLPAEEYYPVYGAWLESDEAGAMRELETMEPGQMRGVALSGIANGLQMKGRTPEAIALAKRWPDEIPQPLLGKLLHCQDAKDAELILREVPRLENDSLRLPRYRCALELWFKEDPQAARKWLGENEVPEQVRREFEGK